MQPEAHDEVQLLDPAAYSRALEAALCGVRATLLLPVFGSPARSSCAAVLEVVQAQAMPFELLDQALSTVLEVRNGTTPGMLGICLAGGFRARLPCGWRHSNFSPGSLPAGERPVHLRWGGRAPVHASWRSASCGAVSAGKCMALSTHQPACAWPKHGICTVNRYRLAMHVYAPRCGAAGNRTEHPIRPRCRAGDGG
jgi:hypothetical protein